MKKKVEDTIVLKFTDYIIKGIADLTPWGGGIACIHMHPFHLSKITKKLLLENLNDSGFGVESINGAICEIYKNYEGTLIYQETMVVGKVSEYTHEMYNGDYL